ncbi:MAG: hypothetical protein ACOYI3_09155 [Christensenellales bacterium]
MVSQNPASGKSVPAGTSVSVVLEYSEE